MEPDKKYLMAGCLFLFANAQDTVFPAHVNPIIRHKFTADPAALVYNG